MAIELIEQSDARDQDLGLQAPDPEQIAGVDTDAVIKLGQAVTALGVLPYEVSSGLYKLPTAIKLLPLIEKMQSDEGLVPGDIMEYRKPIIAVANVGFVDKLAATAEAVKIKAPRRAINDKIERDFPVKAAEAVEKARAAVAKIEADIEFLASFDNPRQQFETEVQTLAQATREATLRERSIRISSQRPEVPMPELPQGMAGFVARTMLKIRSFFGRFSRQKTAETIDVTAYDAGAGIEQTLRSIISDRADSEARMPMVSRFLLSRLPQTFSITKDRLALVAPEILHFLFSTTPEDEQNKQLMQSVHRNPHELRFVTSYKRNYGRYNLDGIQHAATTLLPALRDVLPTSGASVHESFARVQQLLAAKEAPSEVTESAEQPADAPEKKSSRLKRLFSRS